MPYHITSTKNVEYYTLSPIIRLSWWVGASSVISFHECTQTDILKRCSKVGVIQRKYVRPSLQR
jgi:hypothetical protein